MAVVFAQEPTTKQQAQQEKVEEIAATADDIANDMWLVKVFMRDKKLAAMGFAPEGWERPAFEVYETNLDGRPSMLPLESFAAAVAAGICPLEELELYSVWVETKRLEDLEEDAD